MRLVTQPSDLMRGGQTVALVPTMGALHAGHLSLVELAKQHADRVAVSIFVNPTQFGPAEDFERYPRTMDADLAALEAAGVDEVFSPSVETVYPGFPAPARVSIDPGPTADILEGAIRPGHFAGVCQVVAKLLNLTRPDVAIFGQKDAQQLAIIRQMVSDLNFPVRVIGAPIVRDGDGLALSSRNAYLSAEQRTAALALSRSLRGGAEYSNSLDIVEATWAVLSGAPGVQPEYAALVSADGFVPVFTRTPQGLQEGEVTVGRRTLLVAARVGDTRLIDNLEVHHG